VLSEHESESDRGKHKDKNKTFGRRIKMPEGPELHSSSLFINDSLKDLIFSGKILKSEASKNPVIEWDVPLYKIKAESRGKEMKLWLEEYSPDGKGRQLEKISILFRFGMSGCFKLSTVDDIPKHSHLRFKFFQEICSFLSHNFILAKIGSSQEKVKFPFKF